MKKVFIIAEAGVNHNGNLELAKKLIDVATEAGCDAVKFQTFKASEMISDIARKCDYQIENTGNKESQLSMVKALELPYAFHQELKEYCEKNGIIFMSTPFEIESAEFLNNLGLNIFKIPSGEITNLPYLEKINSFGKEVILSTGMSTLKEIEWALKMLNNCSKISLLHCNTEYPTPFEDVNLLAIDTIRKEFNLPVGYSDHTLGIEVAIAAVSLGSEIIEKHITLDKNMEGPDHAASIEPYELIKMVASIRNVEKSLGVKYKKVTDSELKNILNVRKSIVAKKNISKGQEFTTENITVKRPGTGLSPTKWYEVLGTQAKKNFFENELIEIGDNSE